MKKNISTNPIIIWDANFRQDDPPGQCDCDTGDCACSGIDTVSSLLLDKLVPAKTKLCISQTSRSVEINSRFDIWFGPDHRPVVLNKDAGKILFLFNHESAVDEITNLYPDEKNKYLIVIEKLFQAGLLVKKNSTSAKQESQQALTAWLHITDRCNLRCEYCYLPHVKEDMDVDTGKAAIDATFRSAKAGGFSHVKFKYAGGEPLIKFNNVVRLHTYAKVKGLELGIHVKGIILTNGTLLTNEFAEEIKQNNLNIMISLDGVGKAHDSHRPYLGGRGSFEDVKNAILRAKRFGITPDISITVSGKTADSVYEVVEWVLEQELPFSINFYRENDLSISKESLFFEEINMIEGLKKAYEVIQKKLPRRSLLNSLVDRANLSVSHSKTCSVGSNYLVFDQKGRVSKCQMDMKKSITDVNMEDPLKAVIHDKTGIQNLPVVQKECNSCEWKTWCTGGCPLVTFRATGRYDLKSPNCLIYKALYPEAMRLEGLRLLKYADALLL